MKRKFIVRVGDKTYPVEVEEVQEETTQAPAPRPVVIESQAAPSEVTPRPQARVETATGAIRSPLPGKVVSIKCSVGDSVKAGDTVLVLESMKMENAIMAPKSGRVKEIPVVEGANVALDDVLLVIE
ncbi:MAG: biotin/lipoyl-containing protein [Candidatus Bathyarchaeia archaeon]